MDQNDWGRERTGVIVPPAKMMDLASSTTSLKTSAGLSKRYLIVIAAGLLATGGELEVEVEVTLGTGVDRSTLRIIRPSLSGLAKVRSRLCS
jgi:hypothetical protein